MGLFLMLSCRRWGSLDRACASNGQRGASIAQWDTSRLLRLMQLLMLLIKRAAGCAQGRVMMFRLMLNVWMLQQACFNISATNHHHTSPSHITITHHHHPSHVTCFNISATPLHPSLLTRHRLNVTCFRFISSASDGAMLQQQQAAAAAVLKGSSWWQQCTRSMLRSARL